MKNKDNYFQLLRGIAILSVVLIHSFNIKFNGNYSNDITQIIIRQLINFAVPLFLFLSGYFVKLEETQNPLKFIYTRLLRIIPPYLIWSITHAVIFPQYNPDNIIKKLFTGGTSMQLYFIIVLSQLIILTPIMVKTINNKVIKIFIFSITPITIICTYIYTFFTKQVFPYTFFPFTSWILFYYFGLLIRNLNISYDFFKSKLKLIIPIYVISISFSIVEGILIYNNLKLFDLAISQLKITSIITSFALILLTLSLKNSFTISSHNILSKIGDYSFGIFFIHSIFIMLFNTLNVSKYINSQIIFTFIMFCIVSFLSFIIIALCRKTIGNKISSNVLGF